MGRDSARGHGHNELIDAALEIMEERDAMLSRIRDLLEAKDNEQAIPLMRRYCGLKDGLNDDKKSLRNSARLN